jgi:hypothetical protein
MPKKRRKAMYQLCSHEKSGGGACGAPALKKKSYCYFHDPRRLLAARAARIRYFLELPLLENRGAIQTAIAEVTSALGHREIDCELGGRLLYALQLASQGKQLGTPLVKQASPRRLRIAPVPGFETIFSTGRPPANPEALAPSTAKRKFFPAARPTTTPIQPKAVCFQ